MASAPNNSAIPTVAEEYGDSFAVIRQQAESATAQRVADRLRRERRIRNGFYLWNFLVFIGGIIALVIYCTQNH